MHSRIIAQSLVASAAAALMLAAGAYVHFSGVGRAQARLDAARTELRRVEAANAGLRCSLSDLPQVEQRAAAFRERLPAEPDLGGVFESLSVRLAATPVREQEMLTRPTIQTRQFSRVPVTLRFRGPLISAFDVVRHLELLSRFTRVERLTVERIAESEPPQVEIEFSTFSSTSEAGASWSAK